jgi:deazaflavin-dependent oxidoreductase (nitroreductase family)
MTDPAGFNQRIIAEFRENNGKVGGPFEGAPLLLLHSTGARSGKNRVSPVMYLPDDGRYLVFASKAGSDHNPDWYWNLLANTRARIELGDRTLDVRAVELDRAERDEKYRIQAERYPGFADYERKTDRVIPVIALVPVED